jgi:hypothetical protein
MLRKGTGFSYSPGIGFIEAPIKGGEAEKNAGGQLKTSKVRPCTLTQQQPLRTHIQAIAMPWALYGLLKWWSCTLSID